MMLTLYGLPINFNYKDIKILIRTQCKITDFILDSLTAEGNGSKMIRVGLADESEGNHFMKCLNGFHVQGSVLKVMPVGKSTMLQPNVPETTPVESYQSSMMHNHQSYTSPVPQNTGWSGQASQWSASGLAEPRMYQQQQNQMYMQSQPLHQTVSAVGIPLGDRRYPTPQSYEKPISMKENFQRPSQYTAPQQGQSGHYQRPQAPAWASHTQQRPPPFSQDTGKMQYDNRPRQDMRANPDHRELFKGSKAPGRVSPICIPAHFEASNRKTHRDVSDGRMSPEKRLPSRRSSPGRRTSPGRRSSPGRRNTPGRRSSPVRRNSPGRRMSPGRRSPSRRVSPSGRKSPTQDHARNIPLDRRQEVHDRDRRAIGRQSPGRQVLRRHFSPADRQLSGRNMPTSGMPPSTLTSPPRQVLLSGRPASPRRSPIRQILSSRSFPPWAGQPGRELPNVRPSSPPFSQSPQGDHGGRHLSPGRQVIQGGRRLSPSGRQVTQGGRRLSPPGRQVVQGGRRLSPPGRQLPQGGRQLSPTDRQLLQGERRLTPPGRQVVQDGRHLSAPNREVIQVGRRLEPPGHQVLLTGNVSPGRRPGLTSQRNMSPGRQMPGHIAPGGRLPNRPVLLPGRPVSPTRPVLLAHMPPGQMPERHALPMRHISPPKRQTSPNARRISPSGRRISPNRRRMSPNARRMSPSGRRISPNGRRMSPNGRRMSPNGRRMSPSGRRISPSGRRISPNGCRIPPHRRQEPDEMSSDRNLRNRGIPQEMPNNRPLRQLSPDARQAGTRRSPVRQDPQRRQIRYSPPQGREAPKYEQADERLDFKNVRSAYDKAQNQAYVPSSAYHPNVEEEKSYVRKNLGRVSRWQETEKQFPSREIADRSRDLSGPHKPELGRFSEQKRQIEEQKKSRSLTRESPRDRSPIRERVKRHSPSPRSPRRSWALEKRRSPDINKAPPPPVWPGQEAKFHTPNRPQYSGQNQVDANVSFQRKYEDQRHQNNPMDDKRNISSSTWKPHVVDRAPPQRFGEVDRFAEHQEKFERREDRRDDAYHRGIEEGSREGNTRQDYGGTNNPIYIKDENSRPQGHKEYDNFQKRTEMYKQVDGVYERSDNFPKKLEMFPDVEHERDMRHDEYQCRNVADYKEQDGKFKEQPYTQMKLHEKGNNYNESKYLNDAKEIRQKAAIEMARKLMSSYAGKYTGVIRVRIREALRKEIGLMMFEMFGNDDVSFIESVIKFNARHKDEFTIFKKVETTVLSQYKCLERQDLGINEIPPKRSRASDMFKLRKGPPVASHARVIPRAGLKRPLESRQTQPSKVMKNDESHKAVIEGRAVLYQRKPAPRRPPRAIPRRKPRVKANVDRDKRVSQTELGPKAPVKPQAKAAVAEKLADKPVLPNTKLTPQKPHVPATKDSPVQEIASKPKVETVDISHPEPKRQSGDIKVLTVAQINTDSKPVAQNVNTEEKKAEDAKTGEKSVQEKKTESDSSGAPLELDQVTTDVLIEELRVIMAKVWWNLLDSPDAGDSCAIEIIRHEVGEQLRIALGLNVAKRILNVFNPLVVTIQFSRRPESGCLPAFLARHRIKSFRRLQDAANTFAATVSDVTDFEDLCYGGHARCGSADLTITPCYEFTQCPDKMKIDLDDDEDGMFSDEEDEIAEEIEEIEAFKPSVENETESEVFNKVDQESKQDGAKSTVAQSESSKATEKTNNSNEQRKENKEAKTSRNVNVSPKPTEKAILANKEKINAKPKETPKVGDIKPKQNIKTSPNKAKVVRKGVKTINIKRNKMVETKKASARKIATKGRYNVYRRYNEDRRTPRGGAKATSRGSFEVIDEAYEDDDELDDADILEMLSGGVVLDECGSDD